jgi:hypothetical protein
MLVTLILISALLAGAAVLVSMQLSSNRATEISQDGMKSLYCAEAGLSAARTVVAANIGSWASGAVGSGLGAGTEPTWLSTAINAAVGSHDLDGDGAADFEVFLEDNDDDADTANDSDERVFVVSRCIKYPDTPKAVKELVKMAGAASCYQAQEGGCGQNGNSNPAP